MPPLHQPLARQRHRRHAQHLDHAVPHRHRTGGADGSADRRHRAGGCPGRLGCGHHHRRCLHHHVGQRAHAGRHRAQQHHHPHPLIARRRPALRGLPPVRDIAPKGGPSTPRLEGYLAAGSPLSYRVHPYHA
ncbi:hypothetical protein RA210_U420003 [Rubrivivax sp. A210]|nr:hypothetical protein RA210_U420003 [Rubrivivax sp. A210]